MEKTRILLVEDQLADARLTQEALAESHAGEFDIVHVTRLQEALEHLAREQFEALLLDLSLPDAHGLETVIQVQRAAPGLPIVILSGIADDEALPLQAVEAGAQDFLSKGMESGRILARALRLAIARKRSLDHFVHLAQHDPLTDLPNRILFQERLARALEHAQRSEHCAALMLLDLDFFKNVNDSLGHEAGDRMLQAIGQRLRECVRHRDTVARLGGDEFAVILEDLAGSEDAAAIAEKILDAMTRTFALDGNEVSIDASIGIVMFPDHNPDAVTLFKNADAALYQAKRGGGHDYRFYQPPPARWMPA